MTDEVAHPRIGELDMLRSMSTRIRAAQQTDHQEIERVLEAGFASLIGLEAELGRVRAIARPGAEGPAGTVSGLNARIEVLKARIDALREALIDLRTLAVPPGQARIGYGFVLPSRNGRAHAHRN